MIAVQGREVGLGRIPSPYDRRDNQFPFSIGQRPIAVPTEHYWPEPDRLLDQNGFPRCVAYAWEHHLAASPVRTSTRNADADELYAACKAIDLYPGDGTWVRIALQILQARGHITRYLWAQSLDELRDWVLTMGPAVVGTPWYSGMSNPDAGGVMHPTGQVQGGHAYMVDGGDWTHARILNSWGSWWGDNGHARIAWVDLWALIAGGQGEAAAAEQPALPAYCTESIWPTVREHPWKYRARTRPINAIHWHITASGQPKTSAIEYRDTRDNWFANPNNRVHLPPTPDYGAISSLLIGPGTVCQNVPEELLAAWASWPSDEHAISIEVALPTVTALATEPQADLVIATCRNVARALSAKYGIALGRQFPFQNGIGDLDWTGEAGHFDTYQGRQSGHVDPGEAWWAAYQQQGDDMLELEELLVSVWGAAGEESLPWATRVSYAQYRKAQALAGVDENGNPYPPLAGQLAEHAAKPGHGQ